MLGPIDYIVVAFKGNNFDGSVLSELAKAAESGVIRVVDLLFIIKYEDGTVEMAEAEDQEDELKQIIRQAGYDGELPLLSEDDFAKIGESMANETAAGVLVIEHLWAKGLKKALIDAGAMLVDEGRIHPDNVTAALEEISNSKV